MSSNPRPGPGAATSATPPPQIKAAAELRNRALALIQAGRLAEAQAQLQQAIGIFPGFAEAEIRIGSIRRRLGDAEGAVTRYRRALAIKPDYAWAHLELAITLQRVGDLEDAMTHYRAAVRHNPKLFKTVLFALVDQPNGRFWLDLNALKRELLDDIPEKSAP